MMSKAATREVIAGQLTLTSLLLPLLLLAPLSSALSSSSTSTTTSDPASCADCVRDCDCLEGCLCRPFFYSNEKFTLRVECPGIPDWSRQDVLLGPVSVSLGVQSLAELRRADFPSSSPIVSVTLVGDTRLRPDVFQNLRERLEDVVLVRVALNFSSTFDFLADLPRLRHVSFLGDGEQGGPLALTGAPFRGVGVANLKWLELTDMDIASLGPDVFQGLGAEQVE